jgi:hypothetical protein
MGLFIWTSTITGNPRYFLGERPSNSSVWPHNVLPSIYPIRLCGVPLSFNLPRVTARCGSIPRTHILCYVIANLQTGSCTATISHRGWLYKVGDTMHLSGF